MIIYFKKPNFLKKAIFIGIAFFILLFIAIGIWQSISTYNAWKGHPMYKHLIPPENPNYLPRLYGDKKVEVSNDLTGAMLYLTYIY